MRMVGDRWFNRIIIGFFVCLSHALIGQKIILDADTANEVDDLFAIVRAVKADKLQITALNAVQWQASHWSTPTSMEDSHRLNQKLLGILTPNYPIPTLRGGIDRMFDWGDLAQHSAASTNIIHAAKKLRKGEKLIIVALGALTNIGSALHIAPEIEENLVIYWLGTQTDFEKAQINKVDFNCMMDIRALHTVLNSKVEMHIMPINVASQFTFTLEELLENFKEETEITRYLLDRWRGHVDGGNGKRVLWDLALIQAFLYPEMAPEKKIKTSVDSGNRNIWFYTNIDVDAMKKDLYQCLIP